MVSKKFKEIAEDPRIYEDINITDLETVNPLRSWGTSDKISNFINRCIQRCNPEALYMVGIRYFFRDNKEEAGIERRKSAISEGHQVATDVYGAILVCHGWDSKHEGLKLPYSLNYHNSGRLSVMECRERFWQCLSSFLVHKEVRARILKLHHDNPSIKPCSNCGSPQGPVALLMHWDYWCHTNSIAAIRVTKHTHDTFTANKCEPIFVDW